MRRPPPAGRRRRPLAARGARRSASTLLVARVFGVRLDIGDARVTCRLARSLRPRGAARGSYHPSLTVELQSVPTLQSPDTPYHLMFPGAASSTRALCLLYGTGLALLAPCCLAVPAGHPATPNKNGVAEGSCRSGVPAEALPVDTTQPNTVVGKGTPETCTFAALDAGGSLSLSLSLSLSPPPPSPVLPLPLSLPPSPSLLSLTG